MCEDGCQSCGTCPQSTFIALGYLGSELSQASVLRAFQDGRSRMISVLGSSASRYFSTLHQLFEVSFFISSFVTYKYLPRCHQFLLVFCVQCDPLTLAASQKFRMTGAKLTEMDSSI